MGLGLKQDQIKRRISELEHIKPSSVIEFDEIEYEIRLLLNQLKRIN